jgi:hypothetical protein
MVAEPGVPEGAMRAHPQRGFARCRGAAPARRASLGSYFREVPLRRRLAQFLQNVARSLRSIPSSTEKRDGEPDRR